MPYPSVYRTHKQQVVCIHLSIVEQPRHHVCYTAYELQSVCYTRPRWSSDNHLPSPINALGLLQLPPVVALVGGFLPRPTRGPLRTTRHGFALILQRSTLRTAFTSGQRRRGCDPRRAVEKTATGSQLCAAKSRTRPSSDHHTQHTAPCGVHTLFVSRPLVEPWYPC